MPNLPVIGAIHDILQCTQNRHGVPRSLAQCVDDQVRKDTTSHPEVAGKLCELLEVTSHVDVDVSIPSDRCGTIASTKTDVKAIKDVVKACGKLGVPTTSMQQVVDACDDRVNNHTNLPVVLGIAIPFGVMGLIVIFSCLRLLYRIRMSEVASAPR